VPHVTTHTRSASYTRSDGGYADLYRTIEAGQSGLRRDLLVGRVCYRVDGPDEFVVINATNGSRAGFVRWDATVGAWSIAERRTTATCHGWAGHRR
jgi:hypothetical protein